MKLRHLLAIGFAAVLAAASLGGAFQARFDVKAVWKRYSMSDARLSVELPDDPARFTVPNRERATSKAEVAQGPKLSVGKVIFRFSCVDYPEGSTIDIERAAQSAVASIMGTHGVTEFKFSRTDLKVNGLPSIRLETKYQFNASPVSFWILIVGEGEQLWQASAIFKTAMKDQEDLARRVLDSVRVEKH